EICGLFTESIWPVSGSVSGNRRIVSGQTMEIRVMKCPWCRDTHQEVIESIHFRKLRFYARTTGSIRPHPGRSPSTHARTDQLRKHIVVHHVDGRTSVFAAQVNRPRSIPADQAVLH